MAPCRAGARSHHERKRVARPKTLGAPGASATFARVSTMAQFFEVHPANPQPRLIRQAATILRAGGVIAYPTDSSYALGCHIGDAAAAQRIRQIRGVDDSHLMTLVLRDLSEIGHFAKLDNRQFRIVRQGTPGRYTFLLRATREVPRRLQHPKRSTIGVRVPDHAVAQALLLELAEPTTVIDLTVEPPVVVRAGAGDPARLGIA